MESIGFVFGMLGMSLAIIGWGLVGSLRNEFEDLKKNLEDSGVLKDQTESQDEQILLIAKQTVAFNYSYNNVFSPFGFEDLFNG